MDFIIQSQNIMALVAVPICIMTIISCVKTWNTLWDDNLTNSERSLLMRVALFVLSPIVVFCHECGHALATIQCGGTVAKFYFGFLWGYVIPLGNFTPLQDLWIYLSGNVVEIVLGLLVLLVAFVVQSPPIVAVCVYLAFWSIAGTLVFYTILSMMGAYGDWVAIYGSSEHELVIAIGIFHGLAVAALIWAAYSDKTHLWFARKTIPAMRAQEQVLLQAAGTKNDVSAFLDLAWFYYRYGVYKIATKYTKIVAAADAKLPENQILSAWIELAKDRYKNAKELFIACSQNERASAREQARALLGAAHSEAAAVEIALKGGEGSYADWSGAIALYAKAHEADPSIGDPLFYRAKLLARQHLYKRSVSDLSAALRLQFLDQTLFNKAESSLAQINERLEEEQ